MPKSLRRLPTLLALALLALALTAVSATAATPASHHRHHHRRHRHHAHRSRTAASRRHRARQRVVRAHAAQSCAYADASSSSTARGELDAAVVCLINAQRTSRGLPALHASWRLDDSAQGWTDTMLARNEFDHGTNFASRLSAAGYDWSYAGENIATGFDTPRQVVTAWMASADHCRNILSPDYADVGTGVLARPVASFANGGSTWTQDFGLSMNAFTPSADKKPAAGCPYTV